MNFLLSIHNYFPSGKLTCGMGQKRWVVIGNFETQTHLPTVKVVTMDVKRVCVKGFCGNRIFICLNNSGILVCYESFASGRIEIWHQN